MIELIKRILKPIGKWIMSEEMEMYEDRLKGRPTAQQMYDLKMELKAAKQSALLKEQKLNRRIEDLKQVITYIKETHNIK